MDIGANMCYCKQHIACCLSHVHIYCLARSISLAPLLVNRRKPVGYIILPTFAIEHKIYLGPFARQFPNAQVSTQSTSCRLSLFLKIAKPWCLFGQVWVSPRQWSWPLNLPLRLLGVPRVDGILEEGCATPWGDEIDHKVQLTDFEGVVGRNRWLLLVIPIVPLRPTRCLCVRLGLGRLWRSTSSMSPQKLSLSRTPLSVSLRTRLQFCTSSTLGRWWSLQTTSLWMLRAAACPSPSSRWQTVQTPGAEAGPSWQSASHSSGPLMELKGPSGSCTAA